MLINAAHRAEPGGSVVQSGSCWDRASLFHEGSDRTGVRRYPFFPCGTMHGPNLRMLRWEGSRQRHKVYERIIPKGAEGGQAGDPIPSGESGMDPDHLHGGIRERFVGGVPISCVALQ